MFVQTSGAMTRSFPFPSHKTRQIHNTIPSEPLEHVHGLPREACADAALPCLIEENVVLTCTTQTGGVQPVGSFGAE